MPDTSVVKRPFCAACEWIGPDLPLWTQMKTCRCPDCGAEAEVLKLVGADHPSLSARERARLHWILNETTTEPGKPG
jgi:hypothetical protein